MQNAGMFLVLAVLVAVTVFFRRPAPALPDGSRAVETSHAFHGIRTGTEVDGTVEVRDRSGAVVGRYLLRDEQLYQPPDADDATSIRLVRDHYLADPGFDVGTWVGYSLADLGDDADRGQIGVRISPVRLLYGTLAPDLVVSRDGAGVGLSVFPPAVAFGRAWRSLGIGAWYLSPYHDGGGGWVLGASFTTRH